VALSGGADASGMNPPSVSALQGAAATPYDTPEPQASPRARSLRMPRPELSLLVLLSGLLDLWSLSTNGWANTYYSAAVRSMTTSWSSFFFGSFDSAGVMTVDKPPLALWVQAASAKVFGVHPLSILVPEALMGVATVVLVYDLVRRRFGRLGGFVAGLVLALTPIAVAISRHNNPDALLILCCVGALWALVRGLEDGRVRWLALCGALVGLGFEAKMAVALMVVPGIAAAWLWAAPRARVKGLLAGGAAMVAVGGAWPLAVWLTPAASRPWISGTSDNSIWSLMLGYNGLGRLTGQAGGPAGQAGQAGGGPGGAGGGGMGGVFGGDTGVLRLLDQSMGGQAGWFLGFAIAGGLAILIASRLRRADARTGWLIAVGGAFATTAVAFSSAKGIFHPYYVSFLAPFIAALVGAGFAEMVKGDVSARVLAPVAVALGVLCEIKILHDNPGELGWVPAVLIVGGIAAVAALVLAAAKWRTAILGAAVGALLIAPGAWAVQTPGHATSSTFPAGGPASAGMDGPGGGRGRFAGGPPPGQGFGGAGGQAPGGATGGPGAGAGAGGGMFGGDDASVTEALEYANAHGGGTIAVSSQQGAATQVTAGKDVAALGGFSGRESEVSAQWLAEAVRTGKVRYVLTGGDSSGPSDGRTGSTSVMNAVAETCTKVLTTDSGAVLYDLHGHEAALAAITTT
jgi:4-amino-4-deoxy-L-arabinose transferase-like glycosyltransferase